MNQYDVYFTIFGKKLKVQIDANSEQNAIQTIKDKIVFNKIKKIKTNPFEEGKEIFEKMFGSKPEI